jgi:hypothetical protein
LNQYKWEIDESIAEVIFGATNGRISSGQLKKDVEKLLTNGKEIPRPTFSSRLLQMQETDHASSRYMVSPVLEKEDLGRGKKIFYSLTVEARRRIALGLLLRKIGSWKESAYLLLFYYLQDEYDPTRLPYDMVEKYEFKSEEELESFLTSIHLRKKDLMIKDKKYSKENAHTYSMMTEPNENVRISRTEYKDAGNVVYRYLLPGISPRDIIEGRKVDVAKSRSGYVFEHLFDLEVSRIQLTTRDIQALFDSLEKEGLINRIKSKTMEYLGEDRYEVNIELSKFIKDCWLKLFGGTLFRMMFTWRGFRRPKPAEIDWYKTVWGKRRAYTFFASYQKQLNNVRRDKASHVNPKRTLEEYIKNYDKLLPHEFERIKNVHASVLRSFPYPSNALLEIVYPPFLRMLHQQDRI